MKAGLPRIIGSETGTGTGTGTPVRLAFASFYLIYLFREGSKWHFTMYLSCSFEPG